MLLAMRDMAIVMVKASMLGWLFHDAVLYNFVTLGIFTGSHLTE
jgi:hypothetical protein